MHEYFHKEKKKVYMQSLKSTVNVIRKKHRPLSLNVKFLDRIRDR
jgi:hypothetical protein